MLLIPVGKSMNFKFKSLQDEEKNSIHHLEETQPLIQESEETEIEQLISNSESSFSELI